MASIMDRLKKNSRIKETSVLASSKFFSEQDQCPTNVPMVNVALSGRIDGGLSSGLTVLAGPSKHFKTSFALLMASAYLKQHSDAIMLFYDSSSVPHRVTSSPLTSTRIVYFIHRSPT